jgi:hypothetical protein
MMNIFNLSRLVRVHGLIKNANGTFITIKFKNAEGVEKTINGRTGVRWNDKPSVLFRNPYLINFWSVHDRGFRSIRADRIEVIKSCGRVEIL